jgi:hypothetical protein
MEKQHITEYRIINKLLNRFIQNEFGIGIRVRLSSLVYLSNRYGRKRLTEKVYVLSRHPMDDDTLSKIETDLITNLNRLYQMVLLRPHVVVKRVILVVRYRASPFLPRILPLIDFA